ncbi:acyl-ACP--UDP-N-acetylglucosamine O-acyltransferase [Oligoflexus tunisiensis]|uniref:acyl-ACP--UDP-N-acetylglucosamine O-acyltransferase n=1 Tax=Oligoflexus tunisiensis TaxID=708132 RepID=UPI000AC9ACA8|nr:acyl-ACP--UDP-N-acetylglucosamine O-acyltransferase [Oligoflexus tunisiensis]
MLDYRAEEQKEAPQGTYIHPTALVYKGAELEEGVHVGPRAVIGPKVKLARDVQVGAGAVVEGKTTIGEGTIVYPMATIGSDPQDLKYRGEDTELIIGKNNRLREYVNISIGTVNGGGRTTLNDNNLIMAYTHIGHDCHIGSNCILANGVQLAGHVEVEDFAVFGGMAGGHQFCRFGERAMIAAGAIVVQDVPPYCMVQGDRARISGLNVVGLRRSDLPKQRISDIKNMFKILFNENLTIEDAVSRMELEVPDSEQRRKFIDFLKRSERGVCR